MNESTQTSRSKLHFLEGGGEMGALIRAFDWSRTPIGAPDTWSPALRTLLRILLVNRFPMLLWWGPEYVQFYNDAYIPIPGAKHPAALGQTGRVCWTEIWKVLQPMVDTPFHGGPATWSEDLELEFYRGGYPEETHFTMAYSAVPDETAAGGIGGVLATVHEITEKVVGERRVVVLRDLGARTGEAKTAEEACSIAAQSLAKHSKDIPFALLYLTDPDRKRAHLAAAAGVEKAAAMSIPVIDLENGQRGAVWPLAEVRRTGQMQVVEDLSIFGEAPAGPWPDPPRQAVVLPIRSNVAHQLSGFLVAGLSSRLKFDGAYRDFLDLATTQLAHAIATARAYEEERKRAEALAEIDRAKTAFFSNVSHEFRTPLTLMLGPLESVLARPGLPPEDREQIAIAHRNSLRLLKLVNSLLDFSRIEAGRVKASYAPVDLAALTADLASNFRSAMQAAGLELIVDCPPLPEPVYVDREMWEKIVLNLLSNAFKFTFEGSVTVRLRAEGERALLTVADTGVGIPENELPRIFERFHRVEGAKGRTYEGTGIGLALIQELVKLHGGAVRAASRFGQGSEFTVELPFGSTHLPQDRIHGEPAAQVSTAVRAEAFTGEALTWAARERLENPSDDLFTPVRAQKTASRTRILVIDDNADMREHARRLLEARYEVATAANGREGLDAVLANPPDLVLADVMMPVMDGFEFLARLRASERTRTIPVVMLSARAGEESRVEGLEAGADDYLVKPFTARELLARVEAHLSLSRMRRESEKTQKLTEARLALALQATGMIAWEWDPVKDELVATGDLAGVFGAEVRSSRQGLALVHPEDALEHRAIIDRVAREGGSWDREFRVRRGDTGEIAWISERATSLADENGNVKLVVGVVSDVTKRKAAEEEIERRNVELERANSELEEFTYAASHDLQEPLRTVNIYTELLLKHLGHGADDTAGRFAGFIHHGVGRMEMLIQDLLAYARVVHREQDTGGPVSVEKAIEEALETLRGFILESGASVTYETRGAKVIGVPNQISQVFENVLSNSLKYRSPDRAPEVRITAERSGDEWILAAADNGIGFEPLYAPRIFGLFKRLHKDRYPGTGLGLAICKRIVERYGGRMWAASEGTGKGATIYIALKAAEESAPSAA